MDYTVKLAAALPKGAANGWADQDIASSLYRTRAARREEQPHVAILIYGIKKAEALDDDVNQTTIKVLRAQPVLSEEGRRTIERLLVEEYGEQTMGLTMPFELAALSKRAFADLPRTAAEVDEEESAEQDRMSPTDELRRHLERVHGRAEAAGMTAEEADHRHDADHEGDLPSELAHDREWMGWTRADIEAAEAESDGAAPSGSDKRLAFASRVLGPSLTSPADPFRTDDQPQPYIPPMDLEDLILTPLDSDDDGTSPLDKIEGPDPDYGKDLDDEDDEPSLFSEGHS